MGIRALNCLHTVSRGVVEVAPCHDCLYIGGEDLIHFRERMDAHDDRLKRQMYN